MRVRTSTIHACVRVCMWSHAPSWPRFCWVSASVFDDCVVADVPTGVACTESTPDCTHLCIYPFADMCQWSVRYMCTFVHEFISMYVYMNMHILHTQHSWLHPPACISIRRCMQCVNLSSAYVVVGVYKHNQLYSYVYVLVNVMYAYVYTRIWTCIYAIQVQASRIYVCTYNLYINIYKTRVGLSLKHIAKV